MKPNTTSISNWISPQFERSIDDDLKNISGFVHMMKFWETGAEMYIRETMKGGCREGNIERLMGCFQRLGFNNKRLKFVCSQILMDMDELLSGFAFGEITNPVLGMGGQYGNKKVNLGLETGETAYCGVYRQLYTMSSQRLAVMGLETSEHQIVVSLNGRPLHMGDAEHMLCKVYIASERAPGRSRGGSKNPMVQQHNQHPLFGVSFMETKEVAKTAVHAFLELTKDGQWTVMDSILK